VPVPAPIVQGPFTNTSSSDPLPPPQAEVVGVEVVLGEKERAEASKWNEERIERRLRGEYERAGRQLSELVSLRVLFSF
jgi:outer membrane protein insertion porin family